jgi:hypothetical protein
MRQYQRIWAALKAHKKAVCVSPQSNHERIFRAVRKEKYNDLGFKFICHAAKKNYVLSRCSEGDKLTIRLAPPLEPLAYLKNL